MIDSSSPLFCSETESRITEQNNSQFSMINITRRANRIYHLYDRILFRLKWKKFAVNLRIKFENRIATKLLRLNSGFEAIIQQRKYKYFKRWKLREEFIYLVKLCLQKYHHNNLQLKFKEFKSKTLLNKWAEFLHSLLNAEKKANFIIFCHQIAIREFAFYQWKDRSLKRSNQRTKWITFCTNLRLQQIVLNCLRGKWHLFVWKLKRKHQIELKQIEELRIKWETFSKHFYLFNQKNLFLGERQRLSIHTKWISLSQNLKTNKLVKAAKRSKLHNLFQRYIHHQKISKLNLFNNKLTRAKDKYKTKLFCHKLFYRWHHSFLIRSVYATFVVSCYDQTFNEYIIPIQNSASKTIQNAFRQSLLRQQAKRNMCSYKLFEYWRFRTFIFKTIYPKIITPKLLMKIELEDVDFSFAKDLFFDKNRQIIFYFQRKRVNTRNSKIEDENQLVSSIIKGIELSNSFYVNQNHSLIDYSNELINKELLIKQTLSNYFSLIQFDLPIKVSFDLLLPYINLIHPLYNTIKCDKQAQDINVSYDLSFTNSVQIRSLQNTNFDNKRDISMFELKETINFCKFINNYELYRVNNSILDLTFNLDQMLPISIEYLINMNLNSFLFYSMNYRTETFPFIHIAFEEIKPNLSIDYLLNITPSPKLDQKGLEYEIDMQAIDPPKDITVIQNYSIAHKPSSESSLEYVTKQLMNNKSFNYNFIIHDSRAIWHFEKEELPLSSFCIDSINLDFTINFLDISNQAIKCFEPKYNYSINRNITFNNLNEEFDFEFFTLLQKKENKLDFFQCSQMAKNHAKMINQIFKFDLFIPKIPFHNHNKLAILESIELPRVIRVPSYDLQLSFNDFANINLAILHRFCKGKAQTTRPLNVIFTNLIDLDLDLLTRFNQNGFHITHKQCYKSSIEELDIAFTLNLNLLRCQSISFLNNFVFHHSYKSRKFAEKVFQKVIHLEIPNSILTFYQKRNQSLFNYSTSQFTRIDNWREIPLTIYLGIPVPSVKTLNIIESSTKLNSHKSLERNLGSIHMDIKIPNLFQTDIQKSLDYYSPIEINPKDIDYTSLYQPILQIVHLLIIHLDNLCHFHKSKFNQKHSVPGSTNIGQSKSLILDLSRLTYHFYNSLTILNNAGIQFSRTSASDESEISTLFPSKPTFLHVEIPINAIKSSFKFHLSFFDGSSNRKTISSITFNESNLYQPILGFQQCVELFKDNFDKLYNLTYNKSVGPKWTTERSAKNLNEIDLFDKSHDNNLNFQIPVKVVNSYCLRNQFLYNFSSGLVIETKDLPIISVDLQDFSLLKPFTRKSLHGYCTWKKTPIDRLFEPYSVDLPTFEIQYLFNHFAITINSFYHLDLSRSNDFDTIVNISLNDFELFTLPIEPLLSIESKAKFWLNNSFVECNSVKQSFMFKIGYNVMSKRSIKLFHFHYDGLTEKDKSNEIIIPFNIHLPIDSIDLNRHKCNHLNHLILMDHINLIDSCSLLEIDNLLTISCDFPAMKTSLKQSSMKLLNYNTIQLKQQTEFNKITIPFNIFIPQDSLEINYRNCHQLENLYQDDEIDNLKLIEVNLDLNIPFDVHAMNKVLGRSLIALLNYVSIQLEPHINFSNINIPFNLFIPTDFLCINHRNCHQFENLYQDYQIDTVNPVEVMNLDLEIPFNFLAMNDVFQQSLMTMFSYDKIKLQKPSEYNYKSIPFNLSIPTDFFDVNHRYCNQLNNLSQDDHMNTVKSMEVAVQNLDFSTDLEIISNFISNRSIHLFNCDLADSKEPNMSDEINIPFRFFVPNDIGKHNTFQHLNTLCQAHQLKISTNSITSIEIDNLLNISFDVQNMRQIVNKLSMALFNYSSTDFPREYKSKNVNIRFSFNIPIGFWSCNQQKFNQLNHINQINHFTFPNSNFGQIEFDNFIDASFDFLIMNPKKTCQTTYERSINSSINDVLIDDISIEIELSEKYLNHIQLLDFLFFYNPKTQVFTDHLSLKFPIELFSIQINNQKRIESLFNYSHQWLTNFACNRAVLPIADLLQYLMKSTFLDAFENTKNMFFDSIFIPLNLNHLGHFNLDFTFQEIKPKVDCLFNYTNKHHSNQAQLQINHSLNLRSNDFIKDINMNSVVHYKNSSNNLLVVNQCLPTTIIDTNRLIWPNEALITMSEMFLLPFEFLQIVESRKETRNEKTIIARRAAKSLTHEMLGFLFKQRMQQTFEDTLLSTSSQFDLLNIQSRNEIYQNSILFSVYNDSLINSLLVSHVNNIQTASFFASQFKHNHADMILSKSFVNQLKKKLQLDLNSLLNSIVTFEGLALFDQSYTNTNISNDINEACSEISDEFDYTLWLALSDSISHDSNSISSNFLTNVDFHDFYDENSMMVDLDIDILPSNFAENIESKLRTLKNFQPTILTIMNLSLFKVKQSVVSEFSNVLSNALIQHQTSTFDIINFQPHSHLDNVLNKRDFELDEFLSFGDIDNFLCESISVNALNYFEKDELDLNVDFISLNFDLLLSLDLRSILHFTSYHYTYEIPNNLIDFEKSLSFVLLTTVSSTGDFSEEAVQLIISDFDSSLQSNFNSSLKSISKSIKFDIFKHKEVNFYSLPSFVNEIVDQFILSTLSSIFIDLSFLVTHYNEFPISHNINHSNSIMKFLRKEFDDQIIQHLNVFDTINLISITENCQNQNLNSIQQNVIDEIHFDFDLCDFDSKVEFLRSIPNNFDFLTNFTSTDNDFNRLKSFIRKSSISLVQDLSFLFTQKVVTTFDSTFDDFPKSFDVLFSINSIQQHYSLPKSFTQSYYDSFIDSTLCSNLLDSISPEFIAINPVNHQKDDSNVINRIKKEISMSVTQNLQQTFSSNSLEIFGVFDIEKKLEEKTDINDDLIMKQSLDFIENDISDILNQRLEKALNTIFTSNEIDAYAPYQQINHQLEENWPKNDRNEYLGKENEIVSEKAIECVVKNVSIKFNSELRNVLSSAIMLL